MSAIDLIKNNLSIVDVLERYTGAQLNNSRLSRKRFNICCPFHNDRNPSFTVYTDTNTFRCWSGCNKGKPGDVINVVELSQNVEVHSAIALLINDYGLKKPNSRQAKEWEEKRVHYERIERLRRETSQKVFQAIDALKQVEQSIVERIAKIKTEKDLDHIGNLYHVMAQVEYWFECLTEKENIESQSQTLQEISRFLQNMRGSEGEK